MSHSLDGSRSLDGSLGLPVLRVDILNCQIHQSPSLEILLSLKLQTFETQSYQVDLLAKSEIFDNVAIV